MASVSIARLSAVSVTTATAAHAELTSMAHESGAVIPAAYPITALMAAYPNLLGIEWDSEFSRKNMLPKVAPIAASVLIHAAIAKAAAAKSVSVELVTALPQVVGGGSLSSCAL